MKWRNNKFGVCRFCNDSKMINRHKVCFHCWTHDVQIVVKKYGRIPQSLADFWNGDIPYIPQAINNELFPFPLVFVLKPGKQTLRLSFGDVNVWTSSQGDIIEFWKNPQVRCGAILGGKDA